MYFSGEESESTTYDDPENRCVRIIPSLYATVQNDNQQNRRVFLDTHLLRKRDDADEQYSFSERIVPKSDASISVGAMPLMHLVVYVANSLMTSEFGEMSSDEFKESYLAPFDEVLKDTNISDNFLTKRYKYPFGDATHVDDDIQEYFNEIAIPIRGLYRDVGDMDN